MLWPWPWLDDLDVRTWPRHSEDRPNKNTHESRQCLWCCHYENVTARVHVIYAMNVQIQIRMDSVQRLIEHKTAMHGAVNAWSNKRFQFSFEIVDVRYIRNFACKNAPVCMSGVWEATFAWAQPSCERFVATSAGWMAGSDFSCVKVIELVNKYSFVSTTVLSKRHVHRICNSWICRCR